MRSTSARFRPVLLTLLALTAALALTACNADTEPATNVTSTSAVLHADGNGEKGEVVTFWFRYREVGTQAWQETQHIGPTGEFGGSFTNADLTATVTGLKPETTYEYFLCGTLHKPYEAGTPSNPICFDDVKGPTNQVSTFTTDEAPVTSYILNVSKAGSGSGTVTGSGISCGSDCSESYASGASVTLTANAASGSTFAGWSGGGCSGTGSCVVSMTQARSVTATFNTTTPPTGSSVVPGTGAVLAQDLMQSSVNPARIWGGMDSPLSHGFRSDSEWASDTYFQLRTGDGDPHVPIGQSAANDRYRRFITKAGVQSVYDAGVNGKSTRTQMQKWSTSGNQMSFPAGDYVIYMSFRLQSPSPFPYTMDQGGVSGIAKHSQLFQIKSFGGTQSGHTFSPPLIGYIAKDGIGISYHDPIDDSKFQRKIPLTVDGRWIRMAIVSNWDSNGWYEVWADTDNNGSMTKVVDRQTGLDFLGGYTNSALGIGLYHQMSLFDGTKSGQPARDVYTDYANVQITRYTGS